MTESANQPSADKYSGPRFQPRPTGAKVLRVILWLLLLLLLWLIVSLVYVVRDGPNLRMIYPMAGMLLLVMVSVGAQQHAYGGSPRELGAVATIWQLWRKPELRRLPTLPDLPTWRLVLGYALPLLILGLIGVVMWPKIQEVRSLDFNNQQFWARSALSSMEDTASKLEYLHVTCEGFPVVTSPQSMCFVAMPPTSPRTAGPLQDVLDEWLAQNRRWLDWKTAERGKMPTMNEAPKISFKLHTGGGFSGGSQTVQLVQESGLRQTVTWLPYRLDALTRQAPKTGAIPADLNTQSAWLSKQPFDSYFVVTPLNSAP